MKKEWYEMIKNPNLIYEVRMMERKSLEQKRKEFIERIKKEKGNNANGKQ